MVNYRYLGYGITNEQGIAHLDHDANGDPITHSYTGTGAGEIDIVASLDDQSHISDSSIFSETYSILDTMFYDDATDNTKETDWATTNLTVTYNTGRNISNSTSNNVFHRVMSGSSLMSFNTPVVIEFDVISYSEVIIIADGTNQVRQGLGTIGVTTNNTVKIVYDGTVAKFYVDGVYKPNAELTVSNTSINFGFRLGSGGSIEYKNVKIYQI